MHWVHRAYLLLGLWVLLSPWVLGYASISGALWSSIVSGVLILLLALWAIVGGSDGGEPNSS